MASEPCGSENEGGPCVLPAGHGPRHVDRHGGHWRDDLEVPISDEQRARIVADYLARARARRLGDDPGEVARLTARLAERDAEVARLAAAGDALAEAARICDGVMMAAFVPSPEFDDMEPSEGWRMLRSALDDWRAALAARGRES